MALNLGCILESLRELLKILMPRLSLRLIEFDSPAVGSGSNISLKDPLMILMCSQV